MDDRPDISAAFHAETARHVLVAHPAGHAIALAVIDRLNTAGCHVAAVPSVYEAVILLAREPERFTVAVLAVDFLNRDELRFFALAERHWPALTVAAVAQPAFAYKTAIADLLGARAVCSATDAVEDLVRRLDLAAPIVTQTITIPLGNRRSASPPGSLLIVAPTSAEVALEPRGTGTSLPLTGLPQGKPPTESPAPPPPSGVDGLRSRPGESRGEANVVSDLPRPSPPPAVAPLPEGEGVDRRPHQTPPSDTVEREPIIIPARRPPASQNRAAEAARDVLTEEELSALLADMDDDEAEDDRD
jgi:hypothetical protein